MLLKVLRFGDVVPNNPCKFDDCGFGAEVGVIVREAGQ